jgi:excisionase family DNA binding protein
VIELLRAAVEDRQVGGRLVHTAVEAGKLLGIDKERIAGWASAQKIRAWRDGSRWRIPHEEVERLGREGFPRDPGKRGRPRKMPSASSVADEIRALRTRRR